MSTNNSQIMLTFFKKLLTQSAVDADPLLASFVARSQISDKSQWIATSITMTKK
jgi:hypothetical protein